MFSADNDATSQDDYNDSTFMFGAPIKQEKQEKSGKFHYVVITKGNDRGKRFEIGNSASLVFGRTELSDVVLKDTGVSKQHCRMSILGNDLIVTDLNSTNGTFLDGEKITGSQIFPIESMVRIGQHVLKHEYRRREDAESADQIQEDLSKAVSYVLSLLPHPLNDEHFAIDWTFLPSVFLGGDAFGYLPLDEDYFAFYLIDVCGHGAGSAMHSISVINVLRNQSLAKVDFRNPADVLTGLNHIFQMDDHGNLYFTMWYAVYQKSTRKLTFSSAGHPPSLLVSRDQSRSQELKTKGMAIGTIPKMHYREDTTIVHPGDKLFIYSDGAYEVTMEDGREWSLKEFHEVLAKTVPINGEYTPVIKSQVESICGSDKWEDDFSLVAVEFK